MADSFIFLDKNTSFNGTITAEEVVVEGSVRGDINASSRILIKKGARVKGTLQTQKLLFEEGGQHNGLIRLWNEPEMSKSIKNGLPEQPKEAKAVNKPEIDPPKERETKKTEKQEPEAAERLW